MDRELQACGCQGKVKGVKDKQPGYYPEGGKKAGCQGGHGRLVGALTGGGWREPRARC